jgi:hypothetical protein
MVIPVLPVKNKNETQKGKIHLERNLGKEPFKGKEKERSDLEEEEKWIQKDGIQLEIRFKNTLENIVEDTHER